MIWFLVTWNILAFIIMGIDKWKACHRKYRISERTLLTISFLFGSVGIFLGMLVFRHKIRKAKFQILVPLCLICHCIVIRLVLLD